MDKQQSQFMPKKEIEEFVLSKKEGEIKKVYGPRMLDGQVWEIWVFVREENEYYTRYVFDKINKTYFSEFQEFIVFVNSLMPKKEKLIVLYVASFVFVACAITLLTLLVFGRLQGNLGMTFLGGLIASGGAMFFGQWIQPTIGK